MTNYCTSVSIVHNMMRGASPQDACVDLLKHMVKTDDKNRSAFVCVIAINNRGEIGAASMKAADKFQYALWSNGQSQLVNSAVVF
jgi:isoaspartyl peptidase/L-asparaginase-like protein (Ntn-hydrolase superfamily)